MNRNQSSPAQQYLDMLSELIAVPVTIRKVEDVTWFEGNRCPITVLHVESELPWISGELYALQLLRQPLVPGRDENARESLMQIAHLAGIDPAPALKELRDANPDRSNCMELDAIREKVFSMSWMVLEILRTDTFDVVPAPTMSNAQFDLS